MISFAPTADNLYIVEMTDNFNCADILRRCDEMMERGDVSDACQLRLEAATTCLDALYDYDETPELVMSNATNLSFAEIIFASGVDHYMIGDYEVSAAMLETLLEVDPEDHFGATIYLAFNYAAMFMWDDMDDLAQLLDEKSAEYQFLTLFCALSHNKPTAPLHPALKRALADPASPLTNFIIPIALSSQETIAATIKMAQ